jgi:hypothetical protein
MTISSAEQIPGRSALRAALRKATEALMEEIREPTGSPPSWNEFEWGIARSAVAIHGIAGILLPKLRWPEPAHWRNFLSTQVAEIQDRQRQFTAALGEIETIAVNAGVPAMMLKGCALHALGIYQSGERPMADIDLLVKPGDAEAMAGLLERAGFSAVSSTWKHRAFARVRGTDSLSLDLHVRLMERLAGRFVELPGLSFGVERGGLLGYATQASMMRHVLLHTAGNMSRRWVRGIHLQDIARLATQMSVADWQELRSREWPDRWCLFPPLLLATRYFPGVIDPETLLELEATCPRWLTRWARRQELSDVSASNPYLLALPELSWCTSLPVLLRYVKMRVIPERETLDAMRGLTKSMDFARGQSWFTMSHPRRIATWLFRSPIRPATLHAVRRGLGYGGTPSSNNSTIHSP